MRYKGFGWVITYSFHMKRHDGVIVKAQRLMHQNYFRHIGIVGADSYVFKTKHQAQAVLHRLKVESYGFRSMFGRRARVTKIWFGGTVQ